jgi:hypothetical protein
LEEVQALLKLTHQNVCEIYGILCNGLTVDLLLQDAGLFCVCSFIVSHVYD